MWPRSSRSCGRPGGTGRPARRSLPLLPALTLAGLVPEAGAEVPAQPGGMGPGGPQPFAGALAEAVFGDLAAGEFTGDLDPDVVVLDEAVPTLLMAPETLRTTLRAAVAGEHLATRPAVAGQDRDGVLVTGPAGLHELRWNDATSAFDVIVHDDEVWPSALALACGSLDGAQGLDVAGLSADGTTVIQQHADGTSFLPGPSFALYGEGYDLLLLDWNGDGQDEIAALTSFGVEVYDVAGGQVASLSWPLGIRAAVLGDPDRTGERLALLTEVGGNDWLSLMGADGSEGPFNLGPVGPATPAAWDHDDDGDDDLLLGVTTGTALLRYDYVAPSEVPGGPTFDPVAVVALPYGDPARDPSLFAAGLGVADFDHDGDLDVLAPSQGDLPAGGQIASDVELVRSGRYDHTDADIEVLDSTLHGDVMTQITELGLELEAGAPLATGPEQELRLELTVWQTPALDQPATPDAFVPPSRLPMPAAGEEVRFVISWTTTELDDVFGIVLRQVVVNTATGAVEAHGPAVVASYGRDEVFDQLLALPAVIESVETSLDVPGGSSQPGGGMVIGPSAPSFDDDTAPR